MLGFFNLYLICRIFLKFLVNPIDLFHPEDKVYFPEVDVPEVGLGLFGDICPHLRRQVVTSVNFRSLTRILETWTISQKEPTRDSFNDPEM